MDSEALSYCEMSKMAVMKIFSQWTAYPTIDYPASEKYFQNDWWMMHCLWYHNLHHLFGQDATRKKLLVSHLLVITTRSSKIDEEISQNVSPAEGWRSGKGLIPCWLRCAAKVRNFEWLFVVLGGYLFAYGLAESSFLYGQSMSEQPLSRMLPRP